MVNPGFTRIASRAYFESATNMLGSFGALMAVVPWSCNSNAMRYGKGEKGKEFWGQDLLLMPTEFIVSFFLQIHTAKRRKLIRVFNIYNIFNKMSSTCPFVTVNT